MARSRKKSVKKINKKSKNNEDNFLEDTFEYAEKFHKRFRKELVTAVVAAFGFLIALSWREPIVQAIDLFIEFTNLKGNEIYIQIISAILITIIGVLAIMVISKWDVKKDKQENV